MTAANDHYCPTVTPAEARRLRAWAWAVPGGMALCAAGLVGAVFSIPAFDEGALVASVVVLLIGAAVATLGAMLGALPHRYRVGPPVEDANPDGGGGTWKAPQPVPAPSGVGRTPGLGGRDGWDGAPGGDPEWWPAFEPVLAGWLREGATEQTR